MTGQHIQIFLVDGVAGGITTAEIVSWTGHVLSWRPADGRTFGPWPTDGMTHSRVAKSWRRAKPSRVAIAW